MKNENRAAYLAKASGTTGMKVAQMIVDDKRRENMKQIITTTLQENPLAEVNERYSNVEKMLEYKGDISTAVCKHKFASFISHLSKNIVPMATLELLINGETTMIPTEFQTKINKLERDIEMYFY
ncbi:uncharacterized protein LOC127878563 [Dreissena polymorpha]|uniref:Uncharacterized protein n=1 Tax=Dreissena polymorpha TaxID=45954 RepID=A0A9D4KE54_DREPO|nr:uncharacterized protein LOC127878563 [Dreissena polymorpha]KAH3837880.1 hypothetical protein DPMN_111282 [Dreissena polymorpha]